jgi:hypothetical protein
VFDKGNNSEAAFDASCRPSSSSTFPCSNSKVTHQPNLEQEG